MGSFVRHLLFVTRCVASYTALAVGIAALGWLAWRLEQVSTPRLGGWPEGTQPLVIVDAGHGGHDGGATANGQVEKTLALELARQVAKHLEESGLRVFLTREKDVFIPLELRSDVANASQAAVFVSIHLNTGETAQAEGVETYHATQKSLAATRSAARKPDLALDELLARSIQTHVCAGTQAENRGVKPCNFAVVTHSACPAALVECGFLTSPKEARKLATVAYQQKVSRSIAQGITEFLRVHPPVPASQKAAKAVTVGTAR